MSLTQAETVFASVHENGLNDFLTAFFTDRPRHLVYGSPAFVPTTTVAETNMAAIPFPGVPGGIEWRVALSIPRVDLYKQTSPLPPELSLQPGQFGAAITAELCLDCRRLKIDPRPPRGGTTGQPEGKPDDKPTHPLREATCCKLEVFAVGHLEHVLAQNGEDAIALAVDGVEIVDIAPPEVEAILECLLFMILQAVLADVRLPLRSLRVGAFNLSMTVGPLIEDDQIKARGNF
ncbi:hypothetical protein V3H18_08405 [Methylocystis sp. 9N]|uniref:Uncharacterized protein n=1 Tax=Methylocystis borbori TaxID=3118750 RepID=A0ABU7XJ85_9HYPH